MSRMVASTLQFIVALLMAFFLLLQFFGIPAITRDTIRHNPELAHLAVPFAGPAFLAFGCVVVALVALFVLLRMVKEGTVFTESAFRWVNVIIATAWVGSGLTAVPLVYALLVPGPGPGPISLILPVIMLCGVGIALLMTVMRALLRQAVDARSELAEVI